MEYTRALAKLIEEFRKFPSVGPKSAQRMAFDLLRRTNVDEFLHAIQDAKENIKCCSNCFNLTSDPICEICTNPRRNKKQICVVESVKDLIAIERTVEYSGMYHVLGGVISPLDGIGADDINIQPLMNRLKEISESRENEDESLEIILAIGLSTEGEATMLYLKKIIGAVFDNIQITRLAHGLPVGADLDYADEVTISRALEARIAF